MTLLGALRRGRLEDTNTPLTSANLLEWLTGGPSDAGVPVTEQRVLGLPAYYRAVAVTASTLAQLPLHVYRNGTRERVPQRTVLDNPNPRQTPLEFWFTLYAHSLTWGTGFARKLRDGSDTVRQVWPIHPGRVRTEEVDPTDANPSGVVMLVRTAKGEERRYTDAEVMRLPYMSWDGIVGVRPLEIFRQSLGIAIAGDTSAAKLFANGQRLSGILSTEAKLDETAAERLKARWKAKVAGPDHAGDIAVLDSGATFKSITIPPNDAQLLESRQWAVTEIARMVGTPPHLIGDVERSTSWGTGIEEQVLGWVKFTLGGWIELRDQRVTRDLLPGGWSAGSWYAKSKLEGLLRGDSKARAAFYHSGIIDGWMNRNEVRDLEDREPGPDALDDFLAPSNLTLISVDGQLVPLSSDGTTSQGGTP